MKNRIMILAMVAVTLLFAGCQKEDVLTNGQLKLKAEGYGFNTKVAVDGGSSVWVTGDSVLINGDTALVQVSGSEARVSGLSPISAPFYGVYPARICSEYGATCTLNIPAQYTYAVSDGKQVLRSPMVAYASSGNELYFKHVTAAIGVQVVNYYGFTIEVDSIVVVSNSYKLNGLVSVALSGSDPTVTATAAANEAQKKVKMVGGSSLRVFAGDSIVVQIPVLPVGSDNRFTVRTYVHKVDQTAVEKTLEKTQTTGGALARAKIGYARMATPGLFSVSASKKVVISQGNLQYQASTGTWRFAKHQYDAIGNAAGNNVFDDTRSTQAAWIDLFGWGTSGWENRDANDGKDTIICYRPYDYIGTISSSSAYGYGPRHKEGYSYVYTFSLVGDYANSDWGVYNAISNGGNEAGQWRTMTGGGADAEWSYLMSTRNASTVSGVGNARYLKAKVADVNGYIVFPDDFTLPEGVSITSSHINYNGYLSWSGVTTTLSSSDWAKMEVAGAIFLPCTGYRSYSSNNPAFTTDNGYYWSSTYQAAANAYYVQMGSGTPTFTSNAAKRLGCSVRLVRDVD